MGWKHEQVVPEEMDLSSRLHSVALRNHYERYYISRDWLAGRFNGGKVRILDLACGTGFGSEVLSEVGEVVGVDISAESLEYANSRYKNGKVSFRQGNAEDAVFRQSLGKFDAVVSLETVEHLDDHYDYLRWVRATLRPGGALIVSFPSTFTMDWAIPHHKRDISKEAARKMFSDCGFKIVRTHNQSDRIGMHHMIKEARFNSDMPAPPLKQWIKYYLRRPDHALQRLLQMTAGGGILLAHQQYLLKPVGNMKED
ncbi:class I SAM-dependent methyltransferase [candidate division WOR-3 bacterium]|nr:class I SAM-dependent methyltransferase [candidate division WOR-3 bacterium]